jgi:hypothetical protein
MRRFDTRLRRASSMRPRRTAPRPHPHLTDNRWSLEFTDGHFFGSVRPLAGLTSRHCSCPAWRSWCWCGWAIGRSSATWRGRSAAGAGRTRTACGRSRGTSGRERRGGVGSGSPISSSSDPRRRRRGPRRCCNNGWRAFGRATDETRPAAVPSPRCGPFASTRGGTRPAPPGRGLRNWPVFRRTPPSPPACTGWPRRALAGERANQGPVSHSGRDDGGSRWEERSRWRL